jgi:hypothetical protein
MDAGRAGGHVRVMTPIPITRTRPEFQPGPPDRPAWPAIAKGLRHRCPACGKGALYSKYLELVDPAPPAAKT